MDKMAKFARANFAKFHQIFKIFVLNESFDGGIDFRMFANIKEVEMIHFWWSLLTLEFRQYIRYYLQL